MQPLPALHELAELTASYSAAHERSRAARPSKAAAREADAALILSAIDAMSWGPLRTVSMGGLGGLVLRTELGLGPDQVGGDGRMVAGMMEGWWSAALVLFTSRYPRSGRGQAPQQARV